MIIVTSEDLKQIMACSEKESIEFQKFLKKQNC